MREAENLLERGIKMTRYVLALAAMSALSTVCAAHAQSRSGLEVSGEAFYYRYDEPKPEVDVEDKGALLGLGVGYTHVHGAWMARLRGSAALGSIDYSSVDGKLKDITQKIGQLEIHVGRDFDFLGGSTLTPFVGVGARKLIDEFGGREVDGLKGYDRHIRYEYAIAGFDLHTAERDDRNFTISAQYARLIGGSSKAYFGREDPDTPNLNLKFKDGGYGLDVAATMNFQRSAGVISVGPFVRYWNIEESAPREFVEGDFIVTFVEPANTTWKAGVRAVYRF